ncbi:hypothetical protein NM688_g1487 [Phlebia brevispora]|uniref:Uncharacterized protein n=1 Tax=Phlebia brevispora TaxID=194682 RepID=A0ACC1TBJ0_9APHY|nr:hypothetical protein NM688_g1487 [Phlebia brevispora]
MSLIRLPKTLRLWRPVTLGSRWSSSTSLPDFNPLPSFRLTRPPNPKWDLGRGLDDGPDSEGWREDETKGWKSWSTTDLVGRDLYRLLTSAVIPRPIAFVSTISQDGVRNLAPMSYFSLISHDPPLLTMSLTLSKRRPKDTRENIKATKEFTVNIISEPFAEAANVCSVEAPAHVDEWLVSGLTPEASTLVKPPRVKESALYNLMDIPSLRTHEITTTLVFGLIKQIHVRNVVLSEDEATVDPAKLRPVARLGGSTFARLGEGFDLERPSWKALKERIQQMKPN